MTAGPERAALLFDEACREAGVSYVYVGGLAVVAWGQPRATGDVETLVDLQPAGVAPLAAAFQKRGFKFDPRDFRDAFDDHSHVTVHDPDSGFHLDIKLAQDTDEQREVANARVVPFRGGHLRIATPEDTIAWKLRFGSPQDLQDARSILVRQEGRLDEAKLHALVRRLGVQDMLDEVREELRALDNGS